MSPEPPLTVVCCHCGRVRTPTGEWVYPPPLPPWTPVSHGICPDCLVTHYADLLATDRSVTAGR